MKYNVLALQKVVSCKYITCYRKSSSDLTFVVGTDHCFLINWYISGYRTSTIRRFIQMKYIESLGWCWIHNYIISLACFHAALVSTV